jgi:hypothetical protein
VQYELKVIWDEEPMGTLKDYRKTLRETTHAKDIDIKV